MQYLHFSYLIQVGIDEDEVYSEKKGEGKEKD